MRVVALCALLLCALCVLTANAQHPEHVESHSMDDQHHTPTPDTHHVSEVHHDPVHGANVHDPMAHTVAVHTTGDAPGNTVHVIRVRTKNLPPLTAWLVVACVHALT